MRPRDSDVHMDSLNHDRMPRSSLFKKPLRDSSPRWLREFGIDYFYSREIDIAQHVVVEPKRESAPLAVGTPLAYDVEEPADHRRAGP